MKRGAQQVRARVFSDERRLLQLVASGGNTQPCEFIVVTDREKIRQFSVDIGWVEESGGVIAVVMDTSSN